ncbi:MAG: hypothetical protein ABSD85_09715 [Acidimicrobiales bacterium]|jgi:hypothetical protein
MAPQTIGLSPFEPCHRLDDPFVEGRVLEDEPGKDYVHAAVLAQCLNAVLVILAGRRSGEVDGVLDAVVGGISGLQLCRDRVAERRHLQAMGSLEQVDRLYEGAGAIANPADSLPAGPWLHG